MTDDGSVIRSFILAAQSVYAIRAALLTWVDWSCSSDFLGSRLNGSLKQTP